MGELIKFPTTQKPESLEIVNVLEFKKKEDLNASKEIARAYLFESNPRIAAGNEIIVEILGRKFLGIAIDILQKDLNNNVIKISYNIPFLEGDDPFKFGEADFIYSIKNHE